MNVSSLGRFPLLAVLFASAACSGGDDASNTLGAPIGGSVQEVTVPGCFSLLLPSNMDEIPVQGIDSRVGLWERSGFKMTFDCGGYDVDYGEPAAVLVEPVQVEGFAGELAEYEREGDFSGISVLHFTDGGRHIDVAVSYADLEQRALARSILASVGDLWVE